MSMLWSPEQQAWLKALGHRVFELAGAGATGEPPAADPRDEASAEGLPALGGRAGGDRGRETIAAAGRARPRPSETRAEADVASRFDVPGTGVSASPALTVPSRAPDGLLERALLRATGQRTRSEARAVLERLGVDVAALRGNPAAKRALWSRLRPLRPRFPS